MNSSHTRTGFGEAEHGDASHPQSGSSRHATSDTHRDGERVDGRVLRGRRNRQAIIDAYYDLVTETHIVPRAVDIAARAGLSVRSLFQHFGDLQELRVAVLDELCTRALTMTMLDHDIAGPELPLGERMDRTLAVRAELWEMLTPVRQVSTLRQTFADQFVRSTKAKQLRDSLRHHIRVRFAAELSRLPLDLDLASSGLDCALSASTFDHFRIVHGYSIETTIDMMRRLAIAYLNGHHHPQPDN